MVEGDFRGVKVLESGHFLLVPAATVILADWGANLTKFREPQGWGPGALSLACRGLGASIRGEDVTGGIQL